MTFPRWGKIQFWAIRVSDIPDRCWPCLKLQNADAGKTASEQITQNTDGPPLIGQIELLSLELDRDGISMSSFDIRQTVRESPQYSM